MKQQPYKIAICLVAAIIAGCAAPKPHTALPPARPTPISAPKIRVGMTFEEVNQILRQGGIGLIDLPKVKDVPRVEDFYLSDGRHAMKMIFLNGKLKSFVSYLSPK